MNKYLLKQTNIHHHIKTSQKHIKYLTRVFAHTDGTHPVICSVCTADTANNEGVLYIQKVSILVEL